MTAMLIYLFAILTSQDQILCDLWTRAITQEGLRSACGIWKFDDTYRVDVLTLDQRATLCTQPITSLMHILTDCNLPGPLDLYTLRITRHVGRNLLCIVESETATLTREQVLAQCPQAEAVGYSVEPAGTRQNAPKNAWACPRRDLIAGTGLYDQPVNSDALRASEPLSWLAGRLIWNGLHTPTCAGSGLDPYTLAANPCGLTSAQSMVTAWQNQFDTEIYAAALEAQIPPRLLKRIIRLESQFWPFFTEANGEIGIMQITDNGVDTLLRYDPDLEPNYNSLNPQDQLYTRRAWRDKLTCINCSVTQALAKIKADMPIYARLIAAYHCRAVTVTPTLTGNDAWRQAVVDYNGSYEYLRRIEE